MRTRTAFTTTKVPVTRRGKNNDVKSIKPPDKIPWQNDSKDSLDNGIRILNEKIACIECQELQVEWWEFRGMPYGKEPYLIIGTLRPQHGGWRWLERSSWEVRLFDVKPSERKHCAETAARILIGEAAGTAW